MIFNRKFNLKEYWRKWLEHEKNRRVKGLKDASTFMEWDDVRWAFGGQSVTVEPKDVHVLINEDLSKIYQRDNLALKIFYRIPLPLELNMYEASWGHYSYGTGNLVRASKIQNFYARNKLSPMVYDLVFLVYKDRKYAAQITEYVPGNRIHDSLDEVTTKNMYDSIDRVAGDLGIQPRDMVASNFKKGQFLDFQLFDFQGAFRPKLIERVKDKISFGGGKSYQSVEELGIIGKRLNFERSKIFKDAMPPMKDFTVLDFGCNGAYMLRRAFDWGATYGVGVDRKDTVDAAYEIATYLGYFNIDMVETLPERTFDVGFYLSMDLHYPFEEVVEKIDKVMFVEGHAGGEHTVEKYKKMMKPHFKEVRHLGKTTDHPGKNQPRQLFMGVK